MRKYIIGCDPITQARSLEHKFVETRGDFEWTEEGKAVFKENKNGNYILRHGEEQDSSKKQKT